MTLSISSAFDGGNIRLVTVDGNSVDLEIAKDNASDFYQWFYFRLTGCEGKQVELRLTEDPRILGGIITRIGDELIDASVASRLADLQERLS